MKQALNVRSIRGGFGHLAALTTLLVVAAATLIACCNTPPAQTCAVGQSPVVSGVTYAVYARASNKFQVEDVTKVKNRCVVPVLQMPSGAGSTSQASTCAAGTAPLLTGTIWGTYYDGADAGRQAEDTAKVIDRCIVEIPPAITNPCPPGTHARPVGGQAYCVPN